MYSSKIVYRNLGIMRKLKHFFPAYVLHLLYFSLVHPYILYCSSVWLGIFASVVRPIRVLQNNAVRLMVSFQPRDLVRNVYKRIRIIPASGLWELYILLFIFRLIVSGLIERLYQGTNLSCFDSLVNLRSMIHNYDARSSGEIRIPLTVSTRSTFSLLHRGIRSYNNLDQSLKNYGDISFFKSEIKEIPFTKYGF